MGLYSTNKRNAFNTGSFESMYDTLVRNPSLHPLIYFFRMMYLDREGRLLYYPNGEMACTIRSAEGTRQGRVMGVVLYCLLELDVAAWIYELGGFSSCTLTIAISPPTPR